MKVIGVDPGLAATGIGVVEGDGCRVRTFAFGTIRTASETPTAERLLKIHDALAEVMATETPDMMVVEDIFSLGQYPKSGILLGKVSGVIMAVGARAGIPVIEIPVREVKQSLTGNGNAHKSQLERSVRHHLRATSPIRPYHASDALALAIIGLWRNSHQIEVTARSAT